MNKRLTPEQEFTTAWLIEDQCAPQARWWRGVGFSTDANEAIRFARKEDADKVILTTLTDVDFPLIATDHGWYGEKCGEPPTEIDALREELRQANIQNQHLREEISEALDSAKGAELGEGYARADLSEAQARLANLGAKLRISQAATVEAVREKMALESTLQKVRQGETEKALREENRQLWERAEKAEADRDDWRAQLRESVESEVALESRLQQAVEALEELVQANEEWNAAVETVIGRPAGWNADYLNKAKAVIAAIRGEG